MSVSSNGIPANDWSDTVALSANGRYVAFLSGASNLVADDFNRTTDIFIRDRKLGTTARVSVGGGGTEANDRSTSVSMSADGSRIAFSSRASNLVPADTNDCDDVFVRDTRTGTTIRASLANDGSQADVFKYGTGNHPLDGSSATRGHARAYSLAPSISGDGRFVAFWSCATNLVPGEPNPYGGIFVRDLKLRTTIRVNVATRALPGMNSTGNPSISADGRYVAFSSSCCNDKSIEIALRDLRTGTTSMVSVVKRGLFGNGRSEQGSVSANGRYVAFQSQATNLLPGRTTTKGDIFVRDLKTGTNTSMSVSTRGQLGLGHALGPSMSADGRYVAFRFDSPRRPVEVCIWDRQAGKAWSLGSDGTTSGDVSHFVKISADGGWVAFCKCSATGGHQNTLIASIHPGHSK